jgi:PAS domain-containing protein
MSHDSVAFEVLSTQQPVAPRERVAPMPELHPRLCEQVAQARLAGSGALELSQLLPLISAHYEQLDDERRGIVRSMQLIADEARSFGDGLAGADAGHLQAILDHIKDVVITVAVDGTIKIFNPTGERSNGCYPNCPCAARSRTGLNRWQPGLRPTAVTCGRANSTPATRTDTCSRPN